MTKYPAWPPAYTSHPNNWIEKCAVCDGDLSLVAMETASKEYCCSIKCARKIDPALARAWEVNTISTFVTEIQRSVKIKLLDGVLSQVENPKFTWIDPPGHMKLSG